MVDWEITATTIYCDAVDDEVTLMVQADGSTRCTGRDRYLEPGKETFREMNSRSKRLGRQIACEGDACQRTKAYHNELLGKK